MAPYALAPASLEAARAMSPAAVTGAVLIVLTLWLAAALSLLTAAQYVRAIRRAT
jgi:hypothetical protein